MTIANTFASKASIAFVAIAMALSMVSPAQAQTAEELQAQIDSLMATIAALQSQAGVTTTASADAYVFTRALTIGSQGADVTALQNYLIGAGFSIPAGATGYFGAQTQAAVAAWQTANGVMPAAGYFGPVSQAKYNALMAATPSTPSTGDDDDDDDDDDSSSVSLSGEASLGDVDSSDGEDTEIEEGQEAAPVAEFEIEFENGDAQITRIDFSFDATSNGGDEEDAWDTFEEISLWVDGDEVASFTADDEDEWMDDEPTAGKDSVRFSGLDIIGMEDEPVTVVLAVTAQGSIDDLDATWEVDMTEIRFVDADDVTSTEDVNADEVEFEIQVEGADDELIIKSSTEDPDATTLQVDEDGNSDMLTVFAFDMDSDDSTNDLEVNHIAINLNTDDNAITDVVNDAVLIIDGEEFDDFSWTDSTGSTGIINFDIDGDYEIEAGDRVTAELQIEFKKPTGNYSEGATITASTTATGWDVEGADDVTPTGAASGEVHSLRSTGIVVEPGDTSTETQGQGDTSGEFTIEFEVTAFENDIYIAENASTTADAIQGGVFYSIDGPAAVDTETGTLSSTADEDTTGVFTVREGETETFTLTVTVDAGAAGQHRVILEEIYFTENSNGTTGLETYEATPESSYRTGYENILD